MDKIICKHDEFFKTNLQQKEIAIAYLETHLPQELLKLCDFSTLQHEKTEFIDENLKKLLSDVLYSLKINQKDAYIYFLCEHQSSDNELMAFKLLTYSIKIMQNHLNRGYIKLPLVLPLVLYHGKTSPYPFSADIYDCFAEKELAKSYAFKDFQLIDLTILSDDYLAKYDFKLFFELILKHSHDQKILQSIIEILNRSQNLINYFISNDKKMLKPFGHYILSLDLKTKDVPVEILTELDKLIGSDFMTLPEQWREDGVKYGMHIAEQWKQQGMQEGMQQGMQEGMQQKAKETAKNLLKKGMKIHDIAEITELDEITILAIKKQNNL